ncbi:hypothetical protein HYFRA_00002802 [Hymenoscyphus fraxineus]|uniref:Copper-fist domain-containing protein n=1 Tax=Hymenoscyphus fraxineus TaxID=746836 RepID=A0A9N9KPW3_9HELO|nr:hypothetical protein HYFRA_00002802 [Hymenoscyphus fraxineus]
MPLINGMKMACEPCIRGHRSTKCTHASERLMVPVRKPGRPLSQCPHPGGQACMCGSVTAAIPRKQTCGCGGESSTATKSATPVVSHTSISELPSPTKSTFKVQKFTRPPPGNRKQSYDPANFERMDMSSVNIISYKQQIPNMPLSISAPGGYPMVGQPQVYGYPPQYGNIQAQLNHVTMQPLPMPYNSSPIMGINGFSNGSIQEKETYTIESPISAPVIYNNGNTTTVMKAGSCCAPPPPPLTPVNGNHINKVQTNGRSSVSSNGGSCCASKQKTHHQTSSTGTTTSEPEELQVSSCCSSKPTQAMKRETTSTNGTPINTNPPSPTHIMAQGNMPFAQPFYPQYLPNDPTVFIYPPTYGSFQNPLQPSAWRESMRTNNYSSHSPLPMPDTTYNGSQISDAPDTVHTCCCGDSCECVGCAAHPYNDASQSYVRSAYQSMTTDHSGGDLYTNGQSHTNGVENGNGNGKIVEPVASPTAHTPSSTTSGNAEEQSLSASDFFFVNYPFSSDGCGGDTMSCLCGDDCECLGCTIHRQPIPGMPCGGEENTCPCGDNCECIGCTIHQSMRASA